MKGNLRKIQLLLVLMLCLSVFAGCSKKPKKVELNDYISVEFEGYDTKGKAKCQFDLDAFIDDYEDEIEISEDASREVESLTRMNGKSDAEALIHFCVEYELDSSGNLSNGDKVTLKWKCKDNAAERDFNCELVYEDMTYTVEGLDEIGRFDPFEDVDIVINGIAPDTRISVSNAAYPLLTYTCNPYSGFTAGCEIEITVSNDNLDDFCIMKYQMVPSRTSMTYIVDGVDSYMTDLSQLSKESKDILYQTVSDDVTSNLAKTTKYISNDWDIIGYILLVSKDDTTQNRNRLYVIVKETTHYQYSRTYHGDLDAVIDHYVFYEFKDTPIVYADGTVYISNKYYVSGSTWDGCYFDYGDIEDVPGFTTYDELFNEVVNANLNKYTYVEDVDSNYI